MGSSLRRSSDPGLQRRPVSVHGVEAFAEHEGLAIGRLLEGRMQRVRVAVADRVLGVRDAVGDRVEVGVRRREPRVAPNWKRPGLSRWRQNNAS